MCVFVQFVRGQWFISVVFILLILNILALYLCTCWLAVSKKTAPHSRTLHSVTFFCFPPVRLVRLFCYFDFTTLLLCVFVLRDRGIFLVF